MTALKACIKEMMSGPLLALNRKQKTKRKYNNNNNNALLILIPNTGT